MQAQLPRIVKDMTDDIGHNIDHLMDVKLMVIRHLEAHPELMNRIFLEMGSKELRFIINFGFFFGLVQGIPLVGHHRAVPQWWVLPIGGVIIGYFTNWVALWMIFEPTEPRKLGPFKVHGLFIRRQPEVADVYAKIIADDVVTLSHMGDELMHGRKSDRTRRLIEKRLRPSVDRAFGAGAAARARGRRDQRVRRDPRGGGHRGCPVRHHPDEGRGVRSPAELPDPRADLLADVRDAARGLRRDAAGGDAGGRVAPAPARRRAGLCAPG